MPTKPEQSDLLQAFYGRHGEAPLPVLAASSASDSFTMTFEAARIALKYMTPVILLTDGYIGQATEPWKIPEVDSLPEIKPGFVVDKENFAPYKRDPETLARQWAIPGMQGLEHRVGVVRLGSSELELKVVSIEPDGIILELGRANSLLPQPSQSPA